MNKNHIDYLGQELDFFDKANHYRTYQVQLFKKYLSDDFIEVGCGKGGLIPYYQNYLKNISVTEPTKNLFDELKKKNNNNIFIYNLVLSKIDKKFNSILYSDVIEHIKDDEYEIKKAIEKLDTNGKLIIIVPAFNLLYTNYDRDLGHFKRYKKKDFEIIAKNLNLEIIEQKYFDCIGFLMLLMSKFFNLKNKNLGTKVFVWNKMVLISKILDRFFNYSFGKSLICILKKK